MAKGTPLTMITCYDYPMAYLVEQAGIDIVLVGDSLGMTMLGFDSTLPVTMDDMIRHAAAVRRGTPNGWLIGDMPYMSYQASDESAVLNAGRFMAAGRAATASSSKAASRSAPASRPSSTPASRSWATSA